MHESQLLPLVIVLLPREASAQRRGGCDDSVALHGVVEKTAHCYECTWRRSTCARVQQLPVELLP